MRVRLLSDLHFEFHADAGQAFVRQLDRECDVVIVAGDVCDVAGLRRALVLLCRHFAPIPVFYVMGNHEYYGGSRERACIQVYRAIEMVPNLIWHEHHGVTELQGRRLLGTTLWFPPSDAPKDLNDFVQIEAFESWVYRENERAVSFLRRELKPHDIVVSHHLPSHACVAPQYRGSPLNAYFVCDLTDLIHERKPSHWFYGHTHSSGDQVLGVTRLVCNPLGYAGYEENRQFRSNLTIDIDHDTQHGNDQEAS